VALRFRYADGAKGDHRPDSGFSCRGDFQGCWPIARILSAEYEVRNEAIIGSRIRVCTGYGHPFATNFSFSARRSRLMAASRFRAADLDLWGSL
jgi:hypothetical protein